MHADCRQEIGVEAAGVGRDDAYLGMVTKQKRNKWNLQQTRQKDRHREFPGEHFLMNAHEPAVAGDGPHPLLHQ